MLTIARYYIYVSFDDVAGKCDRYWGVMKGEVNFWSEFRVDIGFINALG